MSLRSCATVLAIAIGLSTGSALQAAQVANGLTQNGLSANGLSANGLTANGLTQNGLATNGHSASSSTTRLKAVILQDGAIISLK
jgi:hypothetical protein